MNCMRGAGVDLSGHVILIIEDQPIRALNLQIALEEAGADVVVTHGSLEAVARLEQFAFSAAIIEPGQRALARALQQRGILVVVKPASQSELLARLAAPQPVQHAVSGH